MVFEDSQKIVFAHGSRNNCPAGADGEYPARRSPRHFFVMMNELDQLMERDSGESGRQMEFRKKSCLAILYGAFGHAESYGESCFDGHANRYCVAVKQLVIRCRFQSMSDCVAIVQEYAILTHIPFVCGDNLSLQCHTSCDNGQQDW